jgi:DNA-binding beta-propeller fold protein YncE
VQHGGRADRMPFMIARRPLSLTLALAGLAGCAAPTRDEPAQGPVLWPMPPEMPRYRYEATLRHAGSLVDNSQRAQMRRLLSGDDAGNASFGKPWAVAATGGRVYVSDTEGRRIFVFDLPRRRTFQFGLRLEGELKKPAGLDVDAQGRVYVVDSTARRLVVYDALGLYERHIDGTRDWVRPTAVAVTPDGSRIHVLDTGGVESTSHRLYVHGADGRALGTIGRRGGAPGEFNLPTDVAIGPDGTLWVLDAGNFRVQALSAGGRPLRHFGSVGNGLGQLARPRGLAVDRDGLVYVSDANFCNVQVFQPDGTLLLALGGRGDRDAAGRYLLPSKLACDETGRLYVVDQFFHKVEVIRRLTQAEGHQLQAAAAG